MPTADRVPLLPAPEELRLAYLVVEPTRLMVVAAARRPSAPCPACGTPSQRVHSRYERQLADLPWHGVAVTLRLQVRRFRCAAPRCTRRIFCERLPATAAAYARRSRCLAETLECLDLALGGEAGARAARQLAMPTSPETVLSLLKVDAASAPLSGPVRVLGVDDWAWRQGQRYGTILVDLERRRVLDLLPDRGPDTLVAWLRAHPDVALIRRDRAGGYAEAATRGAPDAIQIADRFHLRRNLTDAVQRVLERHPRALREVAGPVSSARPVPAKRGGPVARRESQPRQAERRQAATRERRRERYKQILTLHARGYSDAAISREVGINRVTVAHRATT